MVLGSEAVFSSTKRDARCREKDSVIKPILWSVDIPDPKDFHALLMPCTQGPELDILGSKGVPPSNVWAIEGRAEELKKMRRILKVRMLDKPMRSDKAIVHIEALMAETGRRFDLVYLDYFSQPGWEHCLALEYLFAVRMLNEGATLILNFGKNRCPSYVSEVNSALPAKNALPTRAYVDTILASEACLGHPQYREFREHVYSSRANSNVDHAYVTSVFKF